MASLQSKGIPLPRKKACDPCRARKVKCAGDDDDDGESKCRQCSHLGLNCTYNSPRTRRQNYQRGRLIQQWRAEQQTTPQVLAPANTIKEVVTMQYDAQFFGAFIQDYERFVYPFHPVVSPAEAQRAIDDMDTNREARAFVYALVAITITLTRAGSIQEHVKTWVDATMQLQDPIMSVDDMTVRRILTCQWLHVVLMDTRNHDLAYYYLRQSISMLQLLRIEDDGDRTTIALDTTERARRQRLYYMVFIHERFMAIEHGKKIILPALPQLSIIDMSVPSSVDHGFRQIYRLFAHVDEDLLSKWNDGAANKDLITPAWIEAKHNSINDETISTYDEDMGLSDFQLADLIITKHWLHMLLWQIAVSQCLLSSESEEKFMSLLFPIRISSHLISTLKNRPKEMFMIHGTAMHKKLFEITDTIGNVLVTVPSASSKARSGRIADFLFLLQFLSSLPNLDLKQRDVLEDKLNALQNMYPDEAWTASPSNLLEESQST